MNARALFLFIIFLLAGTLAASAQCTPNPNMGSRIIDPERLPDGNPNHPYSVNFSFRIPRDTFIRNGNQTYNIQIRRAELLAITGIPFGFSYQCNPSNCTFDGGSTGCALLTGNPTDSQIREYPIKVITKVYFIFPPNTNDEFNRVEADSNYVFKIMYPSGLELVKQDFQPLKVYPNPTASVLKVDVAGVKEYTLKVVDVLGRYVLTQPGELTAFHETLSLDLSAQPPGVYTVTLSTADRAYLAKVIRR
jgi:hypothetical protein